MVGCVERLRCCRGLPGEREGGCGVREWCERVWCEYFLQARRG